MLQNNNIFILSSRIHLGKDTSFPILTVHKECDWMELALSYDDVLLKPKYSSLNSRSEATLESKLTNNVPLHIPLCMANMDSVVNAKSAIALARMGGIAFMHQFMTIEQQALEIRKVKRAANVLVEDPITITEEKTLADAKKLMSENHITTLVVVKGKTPVGILTRRDYSFEEDDTVLVKDLMTTTLITASLGSSVDDEIALMKKHKIEKVIVVDKDKLKGLVTMKDIRMRRKWPHALRDKKGRLMIVGCVGVKDYLERAKALIAEGVDAICVDLAHGHSKHMIDAVKGLKKLNIGVIAGNVCTAEGAEALIKAGADCIKVGVGPGSACTTRLVSGAGIPQITALLDVAKTCKKHNIPFIADGGIKGSGDIVKALAAGAHSVMIGGLFAGTEESPGETFIKNGKKFKLFRGMASLGANLGRQERINGDSKNVEDINKVNAEGVEATVPFRGSVQEVVQPLLRGIRSGISYCGAKTIEEVHKNAEFVRITSGGKRESNPHDIDVL